VEAEGAALPEVSVTITTTGGIELGGKVVELEGVVVVVGVVEVDGTVDVVVGVVDGGAVDKAVVVDVVVVVGSAGGC